MTLSSEHTCDAINSVPLLKTPLYKIHQQFKARMAPFAGYNMPLSYEGTLAEHRHVRSSELTSGAGLFDVSHMGQIWLEGETVISALEKLIVGDIQALPLGMMRYSVLTNEQGGIIDDLMITKVSENKLFLVVNAGRKNVVIPHLRNYLPQGISLTYLPDQALIALQGGNAETVFMQLGITEVSSLKFMQSITTQWNTIALRITRCGYTGEDGFEISLDGTHADSFANVLLNDHRVKLIGLGARNTLRLEAGLCLYGHELTETLSPIEADLLWIMSKRRRTDGGFLGDTVIKRQIQEGTLKRRIGLKPVGRQPVRDGSAIVEPDTLNPLGIVTSGGFSPTLEAPIAMGYLNTDVCEVGKRVWVDIRGKWVEADVANLPFVPHRYKRV
jgi:aminomethyltransferase